MTGAGCAGGPTANSAWGVALVLGMALLSSVGAFGQAGSGWTVADALPPPVSPLSMIAGGLAVGTPADGSPAPYTRDEFSPLLLGLHRAEIVAVGVFPFSYLFTTAILDLGRFVVKAAEADPDLARYAPWFFAPPDRLPFNEDQNTAVFFGSLAMSVVLAVVDALIVAGQ